MIFFQLYLCIWLYCSRYSRWPYYHPGPSSAWQLASCVTRFNMVLADLGRKITTALRSLGSATVINEEVSWHGITYIMVLLLGMSRYGYGAIRYVLRYRYRRVMGFRGSSVFVGSFSGAFSRARGKISQLTHVYKYLPRVACCLIKMLSMKFTSIFASSFSRGRVGKQVLYLMTISCRFSNRCRSGTSAQKI